MSLGHSPSIVTAGLTFIADQANIKSYKGPPIQNLAPAISVAGVGAATGYSSVGSIEVADIPSLGATTVYTNTIQNNYTSYAPNSGNCCPSLHSWDNIVVSPSTLYTYAIVFRCDSGYTGANFMYRYEYTANGGTYVTEGGVYSDANRVDLGGGWYYAWGTFTTSATTNFLGHCGTFYYRYSPYADRLSVAKVMIVAGNYSGLHPKYWPAQSTTRASNSAVTDLLGNTTWTVNNLTYNSDGTFTFNGSSSWIESPTSTIFDTQALTMECWCNPADLAQNGFLFEKGQVNTQYSNFFAGGTFIFRVIGLSTQDLTFAVSSYITVNTWNHIVCTYGGGTKTIYVNGVQVAQATGLTGNIATGQTNQYIGKYGAAGNNYPFNGKIAVSKVYNRALTLAEVLQNFNALRGRYGQ